MESGHPDKNPKILFPGIFQSDDNIISGFTTRNAGDMTSELIRTEILSSLGFDIKLIILKQIHSDSVHTITKHNINSNFSGDALVYCAGYLKTEKIAVSVLTADCVPILMADSLNQVVACVHAGWIGSYKGIVYKTVNSMLEIGARLDNIKVSIGPHIGGCCYNITKERAELFEKLGDRKIILFDLNGKHMLDLQAVNLIWLNKAGIKQYNIEKFGFCTSCRRDLFYSFRQNNQEKRRMLSFIGIR